MSFNFNKIKREKIKEVKALSPVRNFKSKTLGIALESKISNGVKEKRSLISAIEKVRKRGKNPIIAEFKQFSPIEGKIRKLNILKTALEMEKGGACAISVLTDKNFGGGLADLIKVKEKVKIPVLRKDFIVDEFQIEQSYLAGADAVLLIVSLLKDKTKKFVERIHQLGMEALVEVHLEKEIKFALESGARLIGINNRDLKNLRVNLATTEKLIPKIPGDRIIVSESGINDKKDLARVLKAGAISVLIGTTIMLSDNIKEKVREFVKSK